MRTRGSREDVRAVANIALNVRDVSTNDQTTVNERQRTGAKYLIRGNTMYELKRKRGTPNAVVRREWNGGDTLY